jgi:hypothetical protein
MTYSRLYKKKMTTSTSTQEPLMYPWSPPQCNTVNKYLCGPVSISTSEVGLVERFDCCGP